MTVPSVFELLKMTEKQRTGWKLAFLLMVHELRLEPEKSVEIEREIANLKALVASIETMETVK